MRRTMLELGALLLMSGAGLRAAEVVTVTLARPRPEPRPSA
jgi:hypothetical protein